MRRRPGGAPGGAWVDVTCAARRRGAQRRRQERHTGDLATAFQRIGAPGGASARMRARRDWLSARSPVRVATIVREDDAGARCLAAPGDAAQALA